MATLTPTKRSGAQSPATERLYVEPDLEMRTATLAELLPDVAAVPADLVVSGLVLDSREVQPGDAFVAIAGFGAHGLLFTEQARGAGAAAILFEPPAPDEIPAPADAIAVPGLRARMGAMADEFHGRPSHAMTMVGVTGTSGKTSTVQLLAQALTLLGVRSGTIGTLGGAFDPTSDYFTKRAWRAAEVPAANMVADARSVALPPSL